MIFNFYERYIFFGLFNQSLGLGEEVYLAIFSGVGGGNKSGVNLVAFPMFPLIFIWPFMKAVWGLSFPRQTSLKSSSVMVNVASAPVDYPTPIDPEPFFKSINQFLTTGPPFFWRISKPKVDATLPTKGFPSPLSKKTLIISKIPSALSPDEAPPEGAGAEGAVEPEVYLAAILSIFKLT